MPIVLVWEYEKIKHYFRVHAIVLKASIYLMSSSESLKSKTALFSPIRVGDVDFGIGTHPYSIYRKDKLNLFQINGIFGNNILKLASHQIPDDNLCIGFFVFFSNFTKFLIKQKSWFLLSWNWFSQGTISSDNDVMVLAEFN